MLKLTKQQRTTHFKTCQSQEGEEDYKFTNASWERVAFKESYQCHVRHPIFHVNQKNPIWDTFANKIITSYQQLKGIV